MNVEECAQVISHPSRSFGSPEGPVWGTRGGHMMGWVLSDLHFDIPGDRMDET